MLDRENLFKLAKVVANANPSAAVAYSWGEDKFSYSELNDTFRKELAEYAGTPAKYRENKNLIFALVEETIEDILPKKVLAQYGQFAEIKTYAQGEKAVFTQKISAAARRRAKQFITKVGLAGVYEVFKLDGRSYEVQTSAIGGAAQISIEEFMDGRMDWAVLTDIVMEGLDETIYREIVKALHGAVTNLQEANKTTQTRFDEVEMDRLLAVADSYGPATIYCTYEFAATMIPAEGWVSDRMKDEKWNRGHLANYKGHNVIILPQSFEDETNLVKVVDPTHAYIVPAGGNDKPIKVAFEGGTLVDERQNADWSREIQVYKKVGVAAVITNNICVYVNSSVK